MKGLVFTLLILFSATALPFCSADFRIINGMEISIKKASYIAALTPGDYMAHFCGGTIISHRVIATAAHCLEDATLVKAVRVGSEIDDSDGDLYEVEKVVSHSRYQGSTVSDIDITYDYGVVILKKPIKYNRNVTYAHLARHPLPDGTMLTLSGFGDGRVLKQTRIPISNQKKCVEDYGYIPIVLDSHVTFCAGWLTANTTSCFGDSGGPLVYGTRTLYGIVSWGDERCDLENFPSVYARVDTMAEWFQAFINEYQ